MKKRLVVAGIIFALILVLGIYQLHRQNQKTQKTKADIAAAQETLDLDKHGFENVDRLYKKYVSIRNGASSLPDSTTKSETEWNSYYDDLISQIKDITTSAQEERYPNPRIDTFNSDLIIATQKFTNFLTLARSHIDMEFHIKNEKTRVDFDQTYLHGQVTLASETGDYVYYNAAKKTLENDQNQLNTDQGLFDKQQTEIEKFDLLDTLLIKDENHSQS